MTETFTLAHISDVHLSPISGFHPRYWNVKRSLGYLNWHRKRRFIHDPDVARWIAADAIALSPAHIAVTGDLTNLGLPGEFQSALGWLNSLGAPQDVTVVPGNHDIYTARMHGASCFDHWSAYMMPNGAGQVFGGPSPEQFPFVRSFGHVALIGLNSSIPTPPFVAAGRVGAGQLARLAHILDRCHEENMVRIVLIHHPPLPGQAPQRRALEDAHELAGILSNHGAELVLHGHNHEDMMAWHPWRSGRVPVLGVASGSARRAYRKEPAARYNLIHVTGRGRHAEIEIQVRGLLPGADAITDIARYKLDPHAML